MREILRRQRWWLGRIIALPFQLLVFAAVSFLLVQSIPGDPVAVLTGGQADRANYAAIQKQLGLDGSLLHQLLRYLGHTVQLDLGNSIMTGRPVAHEFSDRLPATIELALMSLFFSILLAVGLSYLAVVRPRNPLSYVVRGYARVAGGLPDFAIGVAAVFVFYATLHWAPAPLGRLGSGVDDVPKVTGLPFLDTLLTGHLDATWSMAGHLVLPVGTLVISQAGVLVKMLIAGLEEAVDAPPTRFRIASGASRAMVRASLFRRALPPAVTTSGTLFGYALGGAVIVESIFGFTGIGGYLGDAVSSGDIPAMQGFLVIVAAVSLVVFLIVDLVNMSLDPRRRPGVRTEGS
ncbi:MULTISPECIES: ABC transporter permease [Frankia]|uniref:Dipeptide transport protein (ABC superfamily, membrane) n=1 Tax=Frankia alni (strain DSM 45986 / CECT 9034 / ACN14a) TaxID=326424 RepID=Q0RCM0_FRAAA|nr:MULTISPECIES: ABC transporter permease [Frankia]CAJ64804.1 Dipeptide transport protein (ABC superfamily, membrane) [Frankia alni ACN14a]